MLNTQIQKSEQEFDKDAINKKNDNIRIQEDLIYEQITRFIIKSNSIKSISRGNSLLFKTGTKLTFTITDSQKYYLIHRFYVLWFKILFYQNKED